MLLSTRIADMGISKDKVQRDGGYRAVLSTDGLGHCTNALRRGMRGIAMLLPAVASMRCDVHQQDLFSSMLRIYLGGLGVLWISRRIARSVRHSPSSCT